MNATWAAKRAPAAKSKRKPESPHFFFELLGVSFCQIIGT